MYYCYRCECDTWSVTLRKDCRLGFGTVLMGTVLMGTVVMGTVVMGTVLIGTVLISTVLMLSSS